MRVDFGQGELRVRVIQENDTDELFLRQVILLAGITIAAILCLTQAAQLKSNANRAGETTLYLNVQLA
jgi:hypothetical protein